MAIRYSDLKKTKAASSDFISRRYDPTLLKIIVLFFIVLGVGISLVSLLLTPFQLVVVMTLLMGGLGVYVIMQIQRSRDLVLATEFQNALFASSLSAGCRFSIIVTREGSITYLDGGTQRMFGDALKERQLTLINLMKAAKMVSMDQDKVFEMLLRTSASKLACDLRGQDNRTHRVVLSVEPIARPSGYVLIRARDYTEERAKPAAGNVPPANPLLSKSTIGMFAHVMDRMGMGIYLTDMAGNLIYANPVLEELLGFGEGEVTGGNFTMREVVHGISAIDAMNPGDFEGEHAMLRKQGGLVRAYINQKVVYGEGKKPLGCVAIITNIVDSNPEVKKTLW